MIPSNHSFTGQILKEQGCVQKMGSIITVFSKNFKFSGGLQEMAALVEMIRKNIPHYFNVREQMQTRALAGRADQSRVSCSSVWHRRINRDLRNDKNLRRCLIQDL